MYKRIIGWDVGGAHLKAAFMLDGALQKVSQVPCALWRGLHELEIAIESVMGSFDFPTQESLHAITMTGELVDLFENRQQGVEAISKVMNRRLSGKKLFYAGGLKYEEMPHFVTINHVSENWQYIASANWLASAFYMASKLINFKEYTKVLLVDIGSTTTDFIILNNGKPQCLGFTDAARLQTEELIYSGVIRTPLMALTQKISFKGCLTSLAAEHFSTMADVYRLTGDLVEADDMADTADGKNKTLLASTRRLARMIGHDAEDEDLMAWKDLANEFKRIQLSRLLEVAKLHIARFRLADDITIVGAGTGSFLVKELAMQLGLPFQPSTFLFDDLSSLEVTSDKPADIRYWLNVCLPAYAVAYLALNN